MSEGVRSPTVRSLIRASKRSDGLSAVRSGSSPILRMGDAGWPGGWMERWLACLRSRRLPLEESSLDSIVFAGVCEEGETLVDSPVTGIGVPVDARNFFEGLFFGS